MKIQYTFLLSKRFLHVKFVDQADLKMKDDYKFKEKNYKFHSEKMSFIDFKKKNQKR
jgi:hypothetical protein